MTYEYKGYKLTQAKINNHFTIFNKNGEMVMHAQYDKPLTHERAVELIERFVSTYGKLKGIMDVNDEFYSEGDVSE